MLLTVKNWIQDIFAVKERASDNVLKSPRAEQKYPLPLRGTSAFPQQPTVGELFQQLSVSDQEELLFIQLPDTIPGQPKTSSPEKTKKDDKTEDKRSSQIKTLVSSRFVLCHLKESGFFFFAITFHVFPKQFWPFFN